MTWRKLSKNQLYRASEVFGNISVAWFSAGAISPVFAKPVSLLNLLLTFGISAIMAIFFFIVSLKLAR